MNWLPLPVSLYVGLLLSLSKAVAVLPLSFSITAASDSSMLVVGLSNKKNENQIANFAPLNFLFYVMKKEKALKINILLTKNNLSRRGFHTEKSVVIFSWNDSFKPDGICIKLICSLVFDRSISLMIDFISVLLQNITFLKSNIFIILYFQASIM